MLNGLLKIETISEINQRLEGINKDISRVSENDEVYLLNDRTPRWDIEDMTLILKEIGYTRRLHRGL